VQLVICCLIGVAQKANPANGSWRMVQLPSTKNAPFLLDARSAPEGFRNPIN
jgi:hypothetical protein